MPDPPERELRRTLAEAGLLRLAKCEQIVKARTDTALRQACHLNLREVWILLAAGCPQPVTQKQIASHLGLNQNVMVQLLDGLESSGHVRRHRNPHNRREQHVHLTPKGRHTLQQLKAQQADLYRTILTPLSEPAIRALFDAALAIVNHDDNDTAGKRPSKRAKRPRTN